ncbi:MAG: glycosyltransferase [Gemmatimonadetes bacterium]|nr:glycosyltransferase [Gemmatimonadota bacterium]
MMFDVAFGVPWWIVAWVGAYFALFWPLLWGTRRLRAQTLAARPLDDAAGMRVSVVMSARNEARDLPRCLAALLALDYPRELLEIILVDDLSDDATGAMMDAAAAAHSNVRALHTRDLPDNGLQAKARGLAHGMTHATGDWVLITDADAAVPRGWVRHLLGGVTPQTGMVGGAIVVEVDRWWSVAERMVWAIVQLFPLGLAGWGRPMVCVGPNMGIRRDTYHRAGGLERAPFRVAEDLALFLMVKRSDQHALMRYSADTSVTVRAVPTAQHLFSQQRRWIAGGAEQGWEYGVGVWLTVLWGLGVVAYVLTGWQLSWPLWTLFVAGKLATEWWMLRAQQRCLSLAHHVRYLGALQLCQLVTLVFLPTSFLISRKVRWLGDGYQVKY